MPQPNPINSFGRESGVVLQTQITTLNTWTGTSPNLYYPLNQNPSGYISSTSGTLTLTGATGILNGQLLIGSTGDSAFIQGSLGGSSGIFVQSGSGSLIIGADSTLVRTSQTGGFGGGNVQVTGATVSNPNFTGAGNVTVYTGGGNLVVVSGNTGAYANFVTLSQTGNVVNTSQTGGFLTLGNVGGVRTIQTTGAYPSGFASGSVVISGISIIGITTGAAGQIVISGDTGAYGNFVSLSQTGNVVNTSQTGGFLTLGNVGGVRTIQTTGTFPSGFASGSVVISGISIIGVTTGAAGQIVVSGDTGAYANFVTLSQTGNVVNTSQTGGFTSIKVSGGSLLRLVDLVGSGNVFITTGATPIVTVSGSTTPSGVYMDFASTQNNPTYVEGRLFYDTGEKALSYYNENSNVTQNIGQESWVRVINVGNATITNGKVVYITGAISGLPAIALAQANSTSGSFNIGVTTTDVLQSGRGYVTSLGVVHSINVSGFTPGDKLYLSETTAGAFTATRSTGNNFIAPIGYVLNTGISGLTGNVLVVSPSQALRPDNFYLSGSGLTGAGNVSVILGQAGAFISGNTGAYVNFGSLQNQINLLSGGQSCIFDSGIQQNTSRQFFQFPITFNQPPFVFTQLKYLGITGANPQPVVGVSGVATTGFTGVISTQVGTTGYFLSIFATSGVPALGGILNSQGVTTIAATGITNTGVISGDVMFSGAGNVVVSTGTPINKLIRISGDTGAYSNFTTPSQITGCNEIWIPVGAMTPSTSGPIPTTGIISTGSMVFDVLDFQQSGTPSAYFNLNFPSNWNTSTIKARFHWTETGGTGVTGSVVWGLAATGVDRNEGFNVQYDTGQLVTGSFTTGERMHLATTPFIKISGALSTADTIFFKTYRYSGSFTGNARLIGLSVQYYHTGVNQITY